MDKVVIKVEGKNVYNFIYKIYKKGVQILKASKIDESTMIITVYQKDLNTVLDIKSIYEVSIIKYKGKRRIKGIIYKNKYMLCSVLIGIVLFFILTNIIYDIDIIYSGNNMKDMLYSELKKYGITKYSIAKNYDALEQIKNQIMEDKKEDLEWLMIKRVGTKYIVRLEPRKIDHIEDDNKLYEIVASKDGMIMNIEASRGEIVKNVGDVVKKGDVLISSKINLYENTKKQVSAKGRVYASVWYKVNIEYPLDYHEEKLTGNKKVVYNIKIFDKYIGLKGFKNKYVSDKYIIKNDILPIGINKQIQREYENISYKLSYDEALIKAKSEAKEKLKERLKNNEYIIDEKSLKCELKDSKIVVDMFYTVYEDITAYKEIEGLDVISE